MTHPSIARPAPSSAPGFEDLLVAHQDPILRFIKSIIADHHEAEDLLQKTNLVLWQKRDRFEAGTNFRAWSFAIARLETLNQLKRQRRDQRILAQQWLRESVREAETTGGDPDAEALTALRNCLGRLPDRDRELIMTRYGSDRTLEQYARTLNRSPGTLKARLFKIRGDLRKSIGDYLENSGLPLVTD